MINFIELGFSPEKIELTPIATAQFFSDLHKNSVVYIPERKSFFVYTGKIWERDAENLLTHEEIKYFVLSLIQYFTDAGLKADEKKAKYYQSTLKYYSSYLNRKNRCSLLEDIKGNHMMKMAEFDKNPLIINCINGTLDLVSGFHEHRAEDYLTKIANVKYDPDAKSPRFEQFIDEIMQGNEPLKKYLQKTLGYSITGMSTQECFFIWYGASTRNGKGTLNGTIMHLLGDYALTAQYETFESKKFGSSGGASEDIARLAGARYVAVNEPSEGMVLNSALIKALTGNDKITARYLYEGSFEFVGHFKIIINTNHLPLVPDESVFSSGRVKVIPFSKHFEESEQDHHLKSELIEEKNLSGILNWLVDGFNMYAAESHLIEPKEVTEEVDKYRKDNDKVGEFAHDCITNDLEGKNNVPVSKVYRLYINWCKENGYRPYNKKNFKKKLEKLFYIDLRSNQDHLMGVFIGENVPKEWL